MSTSSLTNQGYTYYQPGGTSTAIFGNSTGRIVTQITDESKLGRWSGFKLNTNGTSYINMITVYQSNKSHGIHTTYMQQVAYMKGQGIMIPDPQKQLLTDLQSLIRKYNVLQETTIVLINANDGLYTRQLLLPSFLHNTNLVPLIENPEQYPPSHSRGSHCINFIFGTVLSHQESPGFTSNPGKTQIIMAYL
jgi:hypothetical protein